MAESVRAEIGVIGGSGLYEFLAEPEHFAVSTPFGSPSAAIAVDRVGLRSVAFLPRHGADHGYPPHRVNYRANVRALRSLGVRRVLAPCAAGSLQPALAPGTVVVPDQFVDRTSGRVQTFMDVGAAPVGFADPYCPRLRESLLAHGDGLVDGGTMVVIEGPRFSTRAKSQWYAAQGWSLVNMTGHPEAVLARELALCYAPVALVTDRDAGVSRGEPVIQADVFAGFSCHIERLRGLLVDVISTRLPERIGCRCAEALHGLTVEFELP